MDLLFISPEPIGEVYRNKANDDPCIPLILAMVIGVSVNNGIRSYQIRFRTKHWATFVQYGLVEKVSANPLASILGAESSAKVKEL